MALRPYRVVDPEITPITLAEAKEYLRVTHDDHDALITAHIEAATDHLDGWNGLLQRALVTQTWELKLDEFPTSEIEIPLAPLQSVEGVFYYDGDGNEQELSSAEYTVDEKGWIVPATTWPATLVAINVVRVRFVAGYPPDSGSPPDLTANIPPALKTAIKMHVDLLYDGTDRPELRLAMQALSEPYRVQWA